MEGKKLVFTMYAESQIHAGKGMDVGVVDLPIQRERTTGFPIIQGIKGSIRANFKFENNLEKEIFGSDPKDQEETSPGKLSFSEAKILLFPVRNPDKLFIWVTSPLALIRFFKALDKTDIVEKIQNKVFEDGKIYSANNVPEGKVWVEELSFAHEELDWVEEVSECIATNIASVEYIKDKMKKDIYIVSDKTFSQILEAFTEIMPRIRIDKTKGTVQEGALWYEEYLPQDTVLFFVVRETIYAKNGLIEELKKEIDNKTMTIGGKESVGKGLVSLKSVEVK
ncbi:type III-B CRISPR module RAMP protein Cmr4 [Fervidobacterium sp. 2310opik-2]|uniref:type III-B CRISPR module RAMP protein Cmr4 n=1 Tax=Fervidobacterium sp. 2310opik-2 TaxID=1755815 RepID=UPI0013DEEF5C|nr:type III-B CRISPR module RAMP protein Cmr4 [Fervidobacterium sp. 2310opik-2]KAF2961060.1 type III-B CRISPR module RAMP protein Cmr4 [Fervidobacterium sp. 2310opik-2]